MSKWPHPILVCSHMFNWSHPILACSRMSNWSHPILTYSQMSNWSYPILTCSHVSNWYHPILACSQMACLPFTYHRIITLLMTRPLTCQNQAAASNMLLVCCLNGLTGLIIISSDRRVSISTSTRMRIRQSCLIL